MANPTSNYSFQMPTSTDLVTDLPADFEVFGQAVDTRLKALQPGTTLGDLAYSSATANTNTRLPIGTNGQVLAVVAGVPAWQNGTTGDIEGVTAGVGISGGGTSGTVTVTNSMATAIDAKGDLIGGTGADTFSRLAVGTNGQVLTADSTAATGLAWASAGGMTSLASGSLSGASVVLSSISGSYTHLQLSISNFQPATNNATFFLRVNADTGANRYFAGAVGSASYTFNSTGWQISQGQESTTNNGTIIIDLFNYTKTTGYKLASGIAITTNSSSGEGYLNSLLAYNQAPAITSLTMLPSGGNFTGGTYTLWGVK